MLRVQKQINEARRASGLSYGERRMMGEVASELLEQNDEVVWRLMGQRIGEQLYSLVLGT